ncbi:MAG: glycosyltransferase [Rhodocyclales bacterium]|nr:glycosyltransferase [Rhodocyclales bacterium]
MRVLMVSDVYFPRINGVSTSIETFRSDLVAAGVKVQLVAPAYPEPHETPATWRVASRRVPFDPEDRLMQRRPLARTLGALAGAGVDLIHIQTPFAAHYAGLRTARRHGLPVLATYHTHFEEYIGHYLPLLPRPLLKGIARRIARQQCNGLDAVVVPSLAMRETLHGYGVTAPLYILPTGIPIAHFAAGQRARFRTRHGIPEHRSVALYVGRVAFEKNIAFLLEAMVHAIQRRPELLLVIAGEGPALQGLQRMAVQLGLADHVRFVGYLDRGTELPDCYGAADVFAFASKTETQGLVLLEAMAAGLPVYALARMGTRDIVQPLRGAVSAPDAPVDFGHGLAELAGDRARLKALAAAGRGFAAEWSSPERAQQLANLYRSLVRPAP